jgi:polysaccharide pyruvyl transferase CsaB
VPDRKIFISGYYGFDNTGDEAILTVMLEHFRELAPGVQISVVSGDPAQTAAAHAVNAVLWSDPLAITQAVRQAGLVLIGGGGLFHDYTGFIPDALLTEGNWGLGFHITPAMLAALYGKPLMLYAVGVGPLFSEHGRQFTRTACEAASVITVRDAGSKEILESLGVPAEKVSVTADPAFALAPAQPERIREIAAAEGLPASQPLIGVVVRHWSFGVHPVFWEKEVAAGLDLFLENAGGGVLFIPFQQIPGEQENDRAVAARVRCQMKHQGRAMLLEGRYRPAELAGLLGSCDLVVGMRLHSLIFSILGKVPFVALRYDPKVSELLRQVGLENFALDLGGIKAELLAQRMREALASRAEYPAARLKDLAKTNATLALETMGRTVPMPSPGVIAWLQLATLAQLRSSRDLRDRWQSSESAKRALEQERETLQAANQDLQQQVRQLQQRSEQFQTAQAELERNIRDLQGAHAQTLCGLRQLQAQWDERLKIYRGQRAWRVMLIFRKAYTLLLRRGWRGRIQFLGWCPGLLLGKTGDLAEYELSFPRVPGGHTLL